MRVLRQAAPDEDGFRWRHGQQHYSGTYWPSVVLGQLTAEALKEVRERAADVNEVLSGYRWGQRNWPVRESRALSTRPGCR